MSETAISRRALLRAAATAGAAGLLAACGANGRTGDRAGQPSPTQASTPPGSSPTPSGSPDAAKPLWRRMAVKGPSARRDHSFTGDPATGAAYLFGGRASGNPLDDLWVLAAGASSWTRVTAEGPAARFGHNAEILDGKLTIFGGQAGSTFFNDVWTFDPARRAWSRVSAGGRSPTTRYGAGSAVVDGRMVISHGFTDSGRFDDTWSWGGAWRDDSPARNRPVKRCLHRTAYLPGSNTIALFGGQTDGRPFLGDLWSYDPASKVWREVKQTGAPAARNLFAMFQAAGSLWVFGGNTAKGPSNSLHAGSAQGAWRTIPAPAGAVPAPRHGIEAALVAPATAYVFGGRGDEGDLDDLWELNVPA